MSRRSRKERNRRPQAEPARPARRDEILVAASPSTAPPPDPALGAELDALEAEWDALLA